MKSRDSERKAAATELSDEVKRIKVHIQAIGRHDAVRTDSVEGSDLLAKVYKTDYDAVTDRGRM